jgi:hypothetical protein
MSFIHVFEYLAGFALFGFMWWLFNGIQQEIQGVSETGIVYELCLFVWVGSIFIYIIFGGLWVVGKYTEREYGGGGDLF